MGLTDQIQLLTIIYQIHIKNLPASSFNIIPEPLDENSSCSPAVLMSSPMVLGTHNRNFISTYHVKCKYKVSCIGMFITPFASDVNLFSFASFSSRDKTWQNNLLEKSIIQ